MVNNKYKGKKIKKILITVIITILSIGCTSNTPSIEYKWVKKNKKILASGYDFEMKKGECEAKGYALPKPTMNSYQGGGFLAGADAGENQLKMNNYYRIRNNLFKSCMYKAGYIRINQ